MDKISFQRDEISYSSAIPLNKLGAQSVVAHNHKNMIFVWIHRRLFVMRDFICQLIWLDYVVALWLRKKLSPFSSTVPPCCVALGFCEVLQQIEFHPIFNDVFAILFGQYFSFSISKHTFEFSNDNHLFSSMKAHVVNSESTCVLFEFVRNHQSKSLWLLFCSECR